ncbi:MAG TPA: hypothetical protein DIU15_18500 [Deltaproteobacteria bacterium]|nr:hypothetical protein [Deltaproteobacteria bacterium]HCP48036.1 hypothetical protein [Deltaproteobacteria bacterium]
MEETTFEEACERLEIPADLRKHVAADAPVRGKMAVARGMLPAEPRVLLGMMYLLLGDSDAGVREAAESGILEIPENRLLGMIDRKTHPKILEFLTYRRPEDTGLRERMVLLPQINTKSICLLAETGTGRIPEIIANNQERLLVTPQLVRFLAKNPEVPQAIIDRTITFLRLYGVEIDEEDVQRTDDADAPAEAPTPTQAAEPAQEAAGEPSSPPPEASETPEPSQAPEPVAPPAAPLAASDRVAGEDPGSSVGPEPHAPGLAAQPLLRPLAPGRLPKGFVPGEVFVPEVPTEPYVPPEGLMNPLAALLEDWGIPRNPQFVVPPVGGWAADTAGAPIMEPVESVGSTSPGRVYAEDAVELGVNNGIDTNESIDLSGSTSIANSDFAFNLNEEAGEFDDGFVDEDSEPEDEEKQSFNKQIQNMSVGDKIKLCYRANKSARELLVRDSNKIVACAVVNSGRITDNEVMTIATNRSIHEEVIRALTSNREYLRKYPVKAALAANPKTPIPTAITLLNSLHVKDLKKIANNRNVSSAVFSAAMKLYKRRKSGQG